MTQDPRNPRPEEGSRRGAEAQRSEHILTLGTAPLLCASAPLCEIHLFTAHASRFAIGILSRATFAALTALAVGCGADAEPRPAGAEAPTAAAKESAPPAVSQLDPVEPPASRPHPRVQFHAPPKPLPPGAVTHDWVSFLGPTHNAISSETKLLKQWPDGGPKLVWEMVKGPSYTSPAIQGDRLVYLHRIGNAEIVECLHRETGEIYWQFEYATQFEDRFGYNNGPRSSPVIDGNRVYTYGAEGKLHCFRLDNGQIIWKRDLSGEFRVPQDFFGVSTTPLVEGDLLIINVGAPGGPCVAAFDKRTGKMVWGAADRWGPSYASPVPAFVHGRRRVFVFAGGESKPPTGGLISLDPANGAIDFEFRWRSRLYESVNASSPVVVGDQVFISANYSTGSALVTINDDFTHELAWTNKGLGTHWMTAVYRDGYFYGFDGHFENDSALLCIDGATGKTMWREVPQWEESVVLPNGSERRVTVGIYRGSLLWADGHFLCLGEYGHLLWLDLTPQGYKELQRVWLFRAQETWALPVLSRGLLYVSQNTRGIINKEPPRLLCYDLRAKE
jgi:outer membrane protein assembly factor BamB